MLRKILMTVTIVPFVAAAFIMFVNQKLTINTLSNEIALTGGQLIDVREPSEYSQSHADGAINIPLSDILNKDYSKIDLNKPIYLICRSGSRAEQAKVALEKNGFKNVKNIGGLVEWEKQGDKVCSTSTPLCS
jgi:rhodanese-related sulfurtransferase